MKFAMYGSGAAGSVFASYLRKGGADIILIDRYEAHMKKVAEEGMHFTIHQEEDGGYKDYDYQLKGFRTYTTAADAAAAEGKVDVIIYMTKATQLEQAIQDSMPVVGDTTVAPIETVHGKVAFLQLVGLTQPELDALARDPDALDGILERMRADDPELVLDMRRTRSFV